MNFEIIQQTFPFIEQHSLWSILERVEPSPEEIESGYLDLSSFQIGSGTFLRYRDTCHSHHYQDITHDLMDYLPGDFNGRDLQRVWLILILLAREDRRVWNWCPDVPTEWFEEDDCFLAPPYQAIPLEIQELQDDKYFPNN